MYDPTVWKTGDIITEEKLNKIETGIVASSKGTFMVKIFNLFAEQEDVYLDCQFSDIADAIDSGLLPLFYFEIAGGPDSYSAHISIPYFYGLDRNSGKVNNLSVRIKLETISNAEGHYVLHTKIITLYIDNDKILKDISEFSQDITTITGS